MKRLTFLSLFAGIGGFDLGFERAGMRCIGQVEIDPFCRKVLAKHWPAVPRYEDVKKFKASMLKETPDVVCGGFPCQDISCANPDGKGLGGERSGLWYEFLRILCEVRPLYAVVENVPALLVRGVDEVLKGLAEVGYDAEWQIIPASAFGAPHRRERFFLVAYRHDEGKLQPQGGESHQRGRSHNGRKPRVADPVGGNSRRRGEVEIGEAQGRTALGRTGGCFGMAHSEFRRSIGEYLADTHSRGFRAEEHREDETTTGGVQKETQKRKRIRTDTSPAHSVKSSRTVAQPRLKRLAGRRGSTLGTEEEESMPSSTARAGRHVPHTKGVRKRKPPDEPVTIPNSRETGPESGNGSGGKMADPQSGGQRADGGARWHSGHTDECGKGWRGWPSGPGRPQFPWERPRLLKLDLGRKFDGVPVGLVRIIAGHFGIPLAEARAWAERNRFKLERFQNKNSLKAYGNSVVPQVVGWVAERLVEVHEKDTRGTKEMTNG